MELVQLNPFPRYVGKHFMTHKNNEFSVCYDSRLFYLLSGIGTIRIKPEKELDLKAGNALFLPPATVYQFRPSSENPLRFMVFDFDLVDSFYNQKGSLGTAYESTFKPELVHRSAAPVVFQSYLISENSHPILNYLQLAEKAVIEQDDYTPIVSSLLKLSLVTMANNINRKGDSEIIDDVCTFIRQNYFREISNDEIAAQFHYHPNYLNKIMKDTIGVTIRQYLINYRISIAKTMLVSTNQSISEVSWNTGFPSPSYFIKVFHRTVGRTPLQYREDKQINNY